MCDMQEVTGSSPMSPTDHPLHAQSGEAGRSLRPPRICASRELRLIIITNDKEVVFRRGEQLDEPQLGGVDVLELVHQEARTAALPAASKLPIPFERRHRADHQVVEVDELTSLH